MKKNIFLWIGLALLVAGTIFACFTNIVNDIPALAVAAFGLGTIVVSIWNKSEKKDWVTIVAICCVSVGAFCCAICGLAQETMTKLISGIIAVVMLIIGIVVPLIKANIEKKKAE